MISAPLPIPSLRLPALRTVLVRGGGLLLAIAAGFVAVRSFDLRTVAAALERADPAWLAPALAIVAAQLVLRAVRLRSILPEATDGEAIGVGSVTSAMLLAMLINNLTPARIGDGVKCYLISRRHHLPFTGVLGSIMLEHGLDAPTLAVVSALVALLLGVAQPLLAMVVAAGGVGLAILVALFTLDLGRLGGGLRGRVSSDSPGLMARAMGPLSHFGSGFRVVDRRRIAGAALVLGLAASLGDALIFWLVAHSMGLSLSMGGAVLIAAAVALSTVLPGAPGYVGTLELAAVGAAAAVGLVGPGALAVALVFHAIQYIPLSLAGLAVLLLGWQGVPLPSARELVAVPVVARAEANGIR